MYSNVKIYPFRRFHCAFFIIPYKARTLDGEKQMINDDMAIGPMIGRICKWLMVNHLKEHDEHFFTIFVV